MSFTSDFDRPPFSSFQAASRFDPYFDIYGLSLKHEPAEKQRTITLIARSPASPPAQALAMNIGRFQPFSIDVRIIFAQIAPAAALNLILQALSQCCTQSPESDDPVGEEPGFAGGSREAHARPRPVLDRGIRCGARKIPAAQLIGWTKEPRV